MINGEDEYEKSTRPRTIRCLQEPSPFVQQGLEELKPEWTIVTDENGQFCFTVHEGMWRINADLLLDEEAADVILGYNTDRGEVVHIENEGIPDLALMQSNYKTTTGFVKCII